MYKIAERVCIHYLHSTTQTFLNLTICQRVKKPKQNEFNQPGACIPEAEWLRLVLGLPEDSVAAAGRAAAPGIFLHTGTRYHGVHIP